ncbi:immunity protein Tsi6 family protein [Arsukibacterium sp.]|uniref:immunity protein Tsi6 family protein n=1 Tax=Arsukibacterium sp. TaxID=1977258 RepID=UPI00356AF0D0
MNYDALKLAANSVIIAIDNNAPRHTSAHVLTSIRNQMVFIRDNAAAGRDPATELSSGSKFTYAVLASRELASPDEMLLQDLIDNVTKIMIEK